MGLLLTVSLVVSSIILLSGTVQLEGAKNNYCNCVNDYNHTISCTLNITVNPFHKDNTYCWLELYSPLTEDTFNCSLKNVENQYSCSTEGDEFSFQEYSKFHITFYTKSNGEIYRVLINSEFWTKNHIKPITPNLNIVWDFRKYNFTWDTGYQTVITQSLEHELMIHKKEYPHDKVPTHPMTNTYYFKDINLAPDTTYVAKVRSKPKQPYDGEWSAWSNTVTWTTEKARVQWTMPLPLPFEKRTFLMWVTTAILLIVFFGVTVSLKLKPCSKIPTPAPYFQPLYNVYKGNFQNWVLYPRYMGEPYKMDELLKIDTLTDTRPVSKEENFQHAAFYQASCQNPYVSHNEKEWAADDQDGCLCSPVELSILKTSFAEMFDSQCLGPDDSGCEDLTPSLDSNEPQEVLCKELEGQVYHDDYCTLSDTPNGLIPTVMFIRTSEEVHSSQSTDMELSPKG